MSKNLIPTKIEKKILWWQSSSKVIFEFVFHGILKGEPGILMGAPMELLERKILEYPYQLAVLVSWWLKKPPSSSKNFFSHDFAYMNKARTT